MSKYEPLWNYISKCGKENVTLSFEEIGKIAGFPFDHSFLKYKKELSEFGWEVVKISLQNQTVLFGKLLYKNQDGIFAF